MFATLDYDKGKKQNKQDFELSQRQIHHLIIQPGAKPGKSLVGARACKPPSPPLHKYKESTLTFIIVSQTNHARCDTKYIVHKLHQAKIKLSSNPNRLRNMKLA